MKNKSLIIILCSISFLFLISFISALPNDANNKINFNYASSSSGGTTLINSTGVNYWNKTGHMLFPIDSQASLSFGGFIGGTNYINSVALAGGNVYGSNNAFASTGGSAYNQYCSADTFGLCVALGSHGDSTGYAGGQYSHADSGAVTYYPYCDSHSAGTCNAQFCSSDSSGYCQGYSSKSSVGGSAQRDFSYAVGTGTYANNPHSIVMGTNVQSYVDSSFNYGVGFNRFIIDGADSGKTTIGINPLNAGYGGDAMLNVFSPDYTIGCAGTINSCSDLNSNSCSYFSGCYTGACIDNGGLSCSGLGESDCNYYQNNYNTCTSNYNNFCNGNLDCSVYDTDYGSCNNKGNTGNTCNPNFNSHTYACEGNSGCESYMTKSDCQNDGNSYGFCNWYFTCDTTGTCSYFNNDQNACPNYNGCFWDTSFYNCQNGNVPYCSQISSSTDCMSPISGCNYDSTTCFGTPSDSSCNALTGTSYCTSSDTNGMCFINQTGDITTISAHTGVGQLNDSYQCIDSTNTKGWYSDASCTNVYIPTAYITNFQGTENHYGSTYYQGNAYHYGTEFFYSTTYFLSTAYTYDLIPNGNRNLGDIYNYYGLSYITTGNFKNINTINLTATNLFINNISATNINATKINTLTNFSVKNIQGITKNITIMKTALTTCSINITGGIIWASDC
jgi:hypothetical protein